MNREKIIEAGIEYQMIRCPMALGGDAFSELIRALNRNYAFEAGAEWALEYVISLLPKIITCVEQGITQSATDDAITKELTALIKQEDNYSNK